MDGSFITEFISKNGLVGTLLLLFVLDKLKVLEKIKKWKNGEPRTHRRADDPEGASFTHIRYATADDLKELRIKVEEHLSKEAQEDIRMGVMETKIQYNSERIEKTDENVEKIFNLISEIKSQMIQMGYGKKQ